MTDEKTTPHADRSLVSVGCAVITVSDTRTSETDTSGQIMRSHLTTAGHQINHTQIIKDDPIQISSLVQSLAKRTDVQVILLNGGTGIAPRDTTFDAIAALLEKTLPGFGEIFRQLSYTEIGSRAIASRAIAGVYKNTLIFSVPGSSKAVKLALEALIIPEVQHLTTLLNTSKTQ